MKSKTSAPSALHTTAGNAFTNLVLEAFRFNGRLVATGDRMSKDLGLSTARWQVLGAIDERPLTVAQIARAMGLRRQSVQRTVNRLQEARTLTLVENPDHRRANLVQLTTRGRTAFRNVMRRQMEWANRVAQGISAGEIGEAVRVMRVLRERLERDNR